MSDDKNAAYREWHGDDPARFVQKLFGDHFVIQIEPAASGFRADMLLWKSTDCGPSVRLGFYDTMNDAKRLAPLAMVAIMACTITALVEVKE